MCSYWGKVQRMQTMSLMCCTVERFTGTLSYTLFLSLVYMRCMYVCMCVCMYVHVCACVCICVHVCAYGGAKLQLFRCYRAFLHYL